MFVETGFMARSRQPALAWTVSPQDNSTLIAAHWINALTLGPAENLQMLRKFADSEPLLVAKNTKVSFFGDPI
jgi:hypothetical protein